MALLQFFKEAKFHETNQVIQLTQEFRAIYEKRAIIATVMGSLIFKVLLASHY